MYFEEFSDINQAIGREKEIKEHDPETEDQVDRIDPTQNGTI